ncbi:hypothetical protein P7K49_029584 [Saguinus oedipus]|uniref:Uncharacterized protein n=1 Tax=Saguinus oedipus TaxID=9490 RepID=A0ABQ9U8I7_SAGOE|nr:hypothetical protein P7K49_029584 [Saguinus oedipus]
MSLDFRTWRAAAVILRDSRPGLRPGILRALPGFTALALLAAPAAGLAACKMSVRRGRRPARPGTLLSWLLCCSALLSPAAGYVIVSSVSWAVTNEVDEELDSASTEEAMPALLEDSSSIWQQSFPASAHKEDAHLRPRAGAARARPLPAPPGMFSYRREGGQAGGALPAPRLRAATARSLAHASAWGCLATVSAHEKVSARRGVRLLGNRDDVLATAWDWDPGPPDVPPALDGTLDTVHNGRRWCLRELAKDVDNQASCQ